MDITVVRRHETALEINKDVKMKRKDIDVIEKTIIMTQDISIEKTCHYERKCMRIRGSLPYQYQSYSKFLGRQALELEDL